MINNNPAGKDGYEWLASFDGCWLKNQKWLRSFLLLYFVPSHLEKKNSGLIFRILGVHKFGRFLPTGGIEIRRITGKKMQAYTLKSISLSSAQEFLYKSCFFESLHIPFFIVLFWRSLWWYFVHDNINMAIELTVVNAIFNIYPIMHQRYTRIRIYKLLSIYRKP